MNSKNYPPGTELKATSKRYKEHDDWRKTIGDEYDGEDAVWPRYFNLTHWIFYQAPPK